MQNVKYLYLTVTGGKDYIAINNVRLPPIIRLSQESCIGITIMEDFLVELTENFTLMATLDRVNRQNDYKVIITPNVATIDIPDNDGKPQEASVDPVEHH